MRLRRMSGTEARQAAEQTPFPVASLDVDRIVDTLLLSLRSQLDGIEQRRAPAGEMQRWRFIDGQFVAAVFSRHVGEIEGHHVAGIGKRNAWTTYV